MDDQEFCTIRMSHLGQGSASVPAGFVISDKVKGVKQETEDDFWKKTIVDSDASFSSPDGKRKTRAKKSDAVFASSISMEDDESDNDADNMDIGNDSDSDYDAGEVKIETTPPSGRRQSPRTRKSAAAEKTDPVVSGVCVVVVVFIQSRAFPS